MSLYVYSHKKIGCSGNEDYSLISFHAEDFGAMYGYAKKSGSLDGDAWLKNFLVDKCRTYWVSCELNGPALKDISLFQVKVDQLISQERFEIVENYSVDDACCYLNQFNFFKDHWPDHFWPDHFLPNFFPDDLTRIELIGCDLLNADYDKNWGGFEIVFDSTEYIIYCRLWS